MYTDPNLNPPNFGPGLPIYPVHCQLVRVYGSELETGFYAGYVQQFSGSDVSDREACYVFDPEGNGLEAGYYITRLISAYTISAVTLPLYAAQESGGGGSDFTLELGDTVGNSVDYGVLFTDASSPTPTLQQDLTSLTLSGDNYFCYDTTNHALYWDFGYSGGTGSVSIGGYHAQPNGGSPYGLPTPNAMLSINYNNVSVGLATDYSEGLVFGTSDGYFGAIAVVGSFGASFEDPNGDYAMFANNSYAAQFADYTGDTAVICNNSLAGYFLDAAGNSATFGDQTQAGLFNDAAGNNVILCDQTLAAKFEDTATNILTVLDGVNQNAVQINNVDGKEIILGDYSGSYATGYFKDVTGNLLYICDENESLHTVSHDAVYSAILSENGTCAGYFSDSSRNVTLCNGSHALKISGETNGAGSGVGTLTNAPSSGNANFWLPILIGSTTRFIPCW